MIETILEVIMGKVLSIRGIYLGDAVLMFKSLRFDNQILSVSIYTHWIIIPTGFWFLFTQMEWII